MLEHIDRSRFRGKTVGVVYGGTSAERPVSLRTGRGLADALREAGYEVAEYDLPADLDRVVAERPAAVLIGLHGGAGENGTLQGFLNLLGVPYTGSGVGASALAIDKERSKALFRDAGVPTPRGVFLAQAGLEADAAGRATEAAGLTLPLVVKPNDDGSSVGVAICRDGEAVAAAVAQISESGASQPSAGALIEEYLAGPEYTVGFFDGQCLGAIEVRPGEDFYDFTAKYESDQTAYIPVEDAELASALERLGRAAYNALGCRGVARVDLKSRAADDPEDLYVLEVNTIPGMTATSLVPKLAARQGISFSAFAESMVAAARTDDG